MPSNLGFPHRGRSAYAIGRLFSPPWKGGVRGWVREAREGLTLETVSRPIPFDDTQRARERRDAATRHQRKLWAMISRLRPKFTRQLPIGPYFADFACRQAKLIVELDGGQHAESGRDRRRDAMII